MAIPPILKVVFADLLRKNKNSRQKTHPIQEAHALTVMEQSRIGACPSKVAYRLVLPGANP